MDFLLLLLLAITPLGCLLFLFFFIKEWGTLLLQCSHCHQLGTLKKLDSPSFKSKNIHNDLLDVEDNVQNMYIYQCKSCDHTIKL